MLSEGKTESLDPWSYQGTTGYLRITNLYDTLVAFDDDLGLVPALAESTEVSQDLKTWTFRLRQGVTFHDGSRLTADDVIHNIRGWLDPGSWPAGNGALQIDPDQVTALDQRTVRVGLTEPDAEFDRTLAFLPFSIKSRNEERGGAPIGTGPFRSSSFTPGSRSEFVRFEDHWREAPVYLDRVIVDSSFTDEGARTNALRSGAIDLLPLAPFGLAKSLESGSTTLLRARSGVFENFYMALNAAPFDDVDVRQALRLLVDRQQMVDVAYSGFGSVSNDVVGRHTPYYDETLTRERDVDRAKFLLRKAGKEGLSVTLQTAPFSDSAARAATLLKAQAKDAGVTVNLDQYDTTAYWADYGKLSFAQTWYYPVTSLANVWTSTFLSTGLLNETHWYRSPDFARTKSLVREAKSSNNEGRRGEIWRELQLQQFNEGGHINFGTYDYLDGVSSKVQGLTPSKYLFASGCNLRRAWINA